MNSRRASRLIYVFFLGFVTLHLAAQTEFPPAPPGFWEWWRYVHSQEGGGGFHADDDGPPVPGGSGDGGGGGGVPTPGPSLPDPGTNLWLLIQKSNNYALVTLSNTIAGSNYLLLAATNLLGPWFTNQSFTATTNTAPATPLYISDSNSFFFIGQQAPPPPAGTLKWVTQLVNPTNLNGDVNGAGLDTSPAISPLGPILITSANSNLFCVDPGLGEVRWSVPSANSNTTASYFTGSASIDSEGTIYAGFFDGNLYSFNPLGQTNWYSSAGVDCSIYSTPAIGSSGLIFATSYSDDYPPSPVGVTAFDSGGTNHWFFQPQSLFTYSGGDILGSPAVGADGTIYFLANGARLYALSSAGNLKWFLPVQVSETGSPAVITPEGSIVVGSSPNGILYCVNPDGSLKWICNLAATNFAGTITCEPTVGPDGVIYCGSDNKDMIAISPSGTINWVFTTTMATFSSPALASDGTLYFGDATNSFYALNSTNGSLLWSNNIGAVIFSSPNILPDGSVVVAAEDGNLYCFWGTAPVDTNSSWPMYQHDPAHTGQVQPSTLDTNCVAPFVFNGGNDGMGNFLFSMTGTPNSTNLNVYASTNLAETNWTLLASNLTLDSVGNAVFVDTNVAGLTNKFYKVGADGCCSKAIGFVLLTVYTNYNLIADQLYQVDDGILAVGGSKPMNTLIDLFTVSNAWDSAEFGTQVFKWNGMSFDGDTNGTTNFPGWFGQGYLTIVPGIAVWMNNVHDLPFTNWFNGLVREQQIFHIQPGTNTFSTNYLSATIPADGYITNITGYVPHNGDTVQLWNNTITNFVAYPYSSGSWTNGVPYLSVGQGFVLITSNTYTWTNVWQQCPSP